MTKTTLTEISITINGKTVTMNLVPCEWNDVMKENPVLARVYEETNND